MPNLTQRVDQSIKQQAEQGLHLVKQGLAQFQDLLTMINQVSGKREQVEAMNKQLETLLGEFEQQVKKL